MGLRIRKCNYLPKALATTTRFKIFTTPSPFNIGANLPLLSHVIGNPYQILDIHDTIVVDIRTAFDRFCDATGKPYLRRGRRRPGGWVCRGGHIQPTRLRSERVSIDPI